jgi:hypothetical protein
MRKWLVTIPQATSASRISGGPALIDKPFDIPRSWMD